ncbi:MAG: D-glycero-alpha-D-manno-heptose-1,7-bisphosphate 7-phosphatase [Armatimonadota bacterium]
MHRAVFLDRDGVINEDRPDYVKNVGELRVYSYVPECIRRLNEAGLKVLVVSNQQCVARGIVSYSDLEAIEHEITRLVKLGGGRIDGFYYCIHLASDKCKCRKPEPGLLIRAAHEHDIDLHQSIMIGDSEKDIVAGKQAGCRTILLLTGSVSAADVPSLSCLPDYIAQDLSEAVDYAIRNLINETEANT